MSKEPIENVINRCRNRIDLSLDCNISDIILLIEEIEDMKNSKRQEAHKPIWHDLGTGD